MKTAVQIADALAAMTPEQQDTAARLLSKLQLLDPRDLDAVERVIDAMNDRRRRTGAK